MKLASITVMILGLAVAVPISGIRLTNLASHVNLSVDDTNGVVYADTYGSMDWDYLFSVDDFVGLKNRATSLCIEANDWIISLTECNSQSRYQHWKVNSLGSAFVFMNRNSSLCLTQSNKIVIGFRCIKTKNQIWLITAPGNC